MAISLKNTETSEEFFLSPAVYKMVFLDGSFVEAHLGFFIDAIEKEKNSVCLQNSTQVAL